NGNEPIVTKTIDGKETVIPPTSVEEKAQRRAELKDRSTFYPSRRHQSEVLEKFVTRMDYAYYCVEEQTTNSSSTKKAILTELVEGAKKMEESSMKDKEETAQESSSKRAGDELESNKLKKRKLNEKVEAEVDDDKEAEGLK
ncbi:hypothetical protein Tco_1484778, partial [Tanacetum coccineum]